MLWFVLLVADFWSKGYLQNHCPLASKVGTRHANFAEGVCFACVSHSVGGGGGGVLCIFSLLGAVSLYYRDIFSAAKDKNQTDLPEVKLATIFVHT